MEKAVRFEIEFTKRVVFKDMTGAIRNVFEIGERCEATHDNGHYFVTSLGGIYHDEAKRI